MRRAFRILAALVVLIGFGWSDTDAQVPLTGAGRGTPGAAAGFSGPGDVNASALAWYSGTRCYSAAYANGVNKAVKLRRASDNTTQDIVCLTTGFVDAASAATFCNATSCFVDTAYDQSGGTLNCTQATQASQMPYVFNAIGTLPAFSPNNIATVLNCTTAALTQAQPFILSYVAKRLGNTTVFGDVFSSATNAVQAGFDLTSGNLFIYAGTAVTAAATEGSLHAVQNTFNNASSEIYVDGSGSTVGAGALNLAGAIGVPTLAGQNTPNATVGEVGIWSGTWSAGQKSNMNANQHGANGYNF